MDRIEAFHAIEVQPPRQEQATPRRLRMAALNAERLTRPESVRHLIEKTGAHIALLSEVDVGMARSGNSHTIRELTGSLGWGYLYGVEFVELDLGDAEEMRRHAGERNACSLHGNAIVSGLGFERPHVIPLEENGGRWFAGVDSAQRRIGGRIALAARLADAPRPLWVVSLHLESKTDPADRRMQVRNLLSALEQLLPNEACIIGGDCNSKALPKGEGKRHLLEQPERYEPFFADLRDAGFSWVTANLASPTQRDGPSKKHPRPFGKLDWFFVRGIAAENPQIVPSLDAQGQPISDHEMIAVDVVF